MRRRFLRAGPTRRLAAILATALLAIASTAAEAWAQPTDTVILMVGAQRVVALPMPVTRIVIGEEGIVDATVEDDNRIQVTGLRAGRTSMSVFTEGSAQGTSYAIEVDQPGRTVAAAPVAAAAAPAAAPAAPAAPAPDGAGLQLALHGQPDLQELQVHSDGPHLLVTGDLVSVEAHTKAMALAKAFGGDAVVDLSRVGGDQMVAVEIRFAAVAATTVNELGFNFQSLGGGFQGASTAPGTVSSFNAGNLSSSAPGLANAAGLALASGLPIASAFNLFLSSPHSNILSVVSALSGAGLTTLLAQPTLVVRSGEHANFLAGGEVPIPVPQGGSAAGAVTITYHPYGVRLDVAPTVLSDRRIVMHVSPEVSEIDNTNALQVNGFSVPAFRKRTTSTTVELGDGESFVIAGLIYSNNTVSENRIPLLGSIPVIGAFFKISANSRERQELIVIATPHLVRPLDTAKLPPLPGVEADAHYNPGIADMFLNTHSLDQAVVTYGLIR